MSEWIKWHGGKQPVADDVRVQVECESGWFDTDAARCYEWSDNDSEACDNIIAYRVIDEGNEQ